MFLPTRRTPNPKRPARTNRFFTVGRAEDLPEGAGAIIELDTGAELALFNVAGCLYAIENFCPHRGASLADGELCDHTVACALHGWQFDVRTGACLTEAESDIETYEVLIENGDIKIKV